MEISARTDEKSIRRACGSRGRRAAGVKERSREEIPSSLLLSLLMKSEDQRRREVDVPYENGIARDGSRATRTVRKSTRMQIEARGETIRIERR